MCGIIAVLLSRTDSSLPLESLLHASFSSSSPSPSLSSSSSLPKSASTVITTPRDIALYASKSITHRGPDWSGTWPRGVSVLDKFLLNQDQRAHIPSVGVEIGDERIITTQTTTESASSPGGGRGRDETLPSLAFAHTRLAIIKPETGAQPLIRYYTSPADLSNCTTVHVAPADSPELMLAHPSNRGAAPYKQLATVLAVNGEIYNYEKLLKEELGMSVSEVRSDCEVIAILWEKFRDFALVMAKLDGDFCFVLYDHLSGTVMVGRDRMGVCSGYYGLSKGGSFHVASEMKSIHSLCNAFVKQIPPGGMITFEQKTRGALDAWTITHEQHLHRFPEVNPTFLAQPILPAFGSDNTKQVLSRIRFILTEAVRKRMMSDVPYGVLLSGGLDSSLMAAIAQRIIKEEQRDVIGFTSQLHSFSIGLPGSPDHKAASEVAAFVGTKHHQLTFTLQDGVDAITDVIYHIETFDVTTIRASTPMYLMARLIKAMGIKMVLSGEGADEIFGGYLYFHTCPNANEMHQECTRKIHKLHCYDVLRANKSMMSWGVEIRVPFLDQQVLAYGMNDWMAEWKMIQGVDHIGRKRIEKHVLRSAFDDPDKPYLPDSILWRQKEQFSDGVGYSWIDGLKEYTAHLISDEEFENREKIYPTKTPQTKEAFFYRKTFEKIFPSKSAVGSVFTEKSIACSTETALKWMEDFKNRSDPSGRAMHEIHTAKKNLKQLVTFENI